MSHEVIVDEAVFMSGQKKIPMSFLTQHFHLIHYKRRAIFKSTSKSRTRPAPLQAKEEGPFSPNVHMRKASAEARRCREQVGN